jgi:alcohol dehydrogenase class IV
MNAALPPKQGRSPSVVRNGGGVLFSATIGNPADEAVARGMRPITLCQPGKILFGNGCAGEFAGHLSGLGLRNVLFVTSPSALAAGHEIVAALRSGGMNVTVHDRITKEPTVAMFEECLSVARALPLDGVIGLGGGSPLDVAKLVAALAKGSQAVRDVFGINQVRGRSLFLACVPTTAGTGSEVSPNAVLLDESCQLKKAAISPHLVPDIACIDPLLTCSVPPAVTAATGLDALTHCIEGYANRNSHPFVDAYALQGIRLIFSSLLDAIEDGRNVEARANVALGSLYGGLCLGPVNTAAVHALAYPLGSEFHVAHGISNAVLLPHVLRFNLPAAPRRYADIALALGVEEAGTASATAERGIEKLTELMDRCPMFRRISEFGVPLDALPRMAKAAMTVTRLLKNNPRAVAEEDALQIYRSTY